MKKRFSLFLLPLLMLTSCESISTIRFPYGSGNEIGVVFSLSSKIKNGYEIKGKAFAVKDAPLTEFTTFSICNNSPMLSNSYIETVLTTFRKGDFNIEKDGSYSLPFTIVLKNLSSYFETTKEDEQKKAYFFIHGTDFNEDDITTYNTYGISYTFDGTAVTFLSY